MDQLIENMLDLVEGGGEHPVNVEMTVRTLGILIRRTTSTNLQGLMIRDGPITVIGVNYALDEISQRYILALHLGIVLLCPDVDTYVVLKADELPEFDLVGIGLEDVGYFARALLVPTRILTCILEDVDEISTEYLQIISARLLVHESILAKRLLDCNGL